MQKIINTKLFSRFITSQKKVEIESGENGEKPFSITKAGKFTLIKREAEGDYPNYKQVIPEKHIVKIKTNRKELMEIVKRLMILQNGTSNTRAVKIKIIENTISIVTEGLKGSASEEMKAEIKTEKDFEPFHILVNADYLVGILNAVESETVTLESNGFYAPLVIYGENKDAQFIVMPLKK
jgi:DNA polymerase-3 subunit beta